MGKKKPVSPAFIARAAKRGIVNGAKVRSPHGTVFTVPDPSQWAYDTLTPDGSVLHNSSPEARYIWDKDAGWAEVVASPKSPSR